MPKAMNKDEAQVVFSLIFITLDILDDFDHKDYANIRKIDNSHIS